MTLDELIQALEKIKQRDPRAATLPVRYPVDVNPADIEDAWLDFPDCVRIA